MTFTTTDRRKLIKALETAMKLAQSLPVTPEPETPAPKAYKPNKAALDRIMGNERISYQDEPHLEKLLENLTGSKSKPGTSIRIRRRVERQSPDPWDSKDEAHSETDSIVPTKKTNKSRTSNATPQAEDRKGKGKGKTTRKAKDSVVDSSVVPNLLSTPCFTNEYVEVLTARGAEGNDRRSH
ncbi:hypothetical protein B0H14DRAFT_3170087 [Mycena olivaceomarginata]|nr:hypothetical protein B0H14DRAFT_3170087 [Mycena olivaceomarginata]